MDELATDFRKLRQEYDELADRLGRYMRRISRDRAILEKAGEEGDGADRGAPVPHEGQGMHRLLSPQQMKAQQEILRRRAGG